MLYEKVSKTLNKEEKDDQQRKVLPWKLVDNAYYFQNDF